MKLIVLCCVYLGKPFGFKMNLNTSIKVIMEIEIPELEKRNIDQSINLINIPIEKVKISSLQKSNSSK